MDFEVPIMDMAAYDYTIQPGNYVARFSFKLPNKISSSLEFKGHCRQKPECKVEHKIKISMLGTGLKDKPKAKAKIYIRQPPMVDLELERALTADVSYYCCFSKGTCTTNAAFFSCFYDTTETAHVNFACNASNLAIDVNQLRYQMRH